MLKRYPYWGWLLLAALCWAFTGYRSYRHVQMSQPASMAKAIGRDLQYREDALNRMLKNPGLIARMFTGTLSVNEVNDLADAPFYVYAFEQDTNEGNILIFWNSNIVVGVCDQDALPGEDYTLFRNNGVYLKRCIRLPGMADFQTLVVLYPITANYPLQNEYLQSSFAAADYIPSSTRISEQRIENSFPVQMHSGKPLFYVQFRAQDQPRWIADVSMLFGLALSLLFSITWVHLMAIALARRKSRYAGLLLIISVAAVTVFCIYVFGLPFHLGELSIFSTQLYAASSVFPSLGVLFIDFFALLWIVIFLLTYFNTQEVRNAGNAKAIYFILYTACLAACAVAPVFILQSLVIDSRITFDVSNFYSINFYTVIGLLAVGLIAGNAAALIYWINKKLSRVADLWVKYLCVLSVCGAICFFTYKSDLVVTYACLWLLLFLVLLDLRIFIRDRGLFGSEMIFWAAFLALTATTVIQYFNDVKEGFKRQLFAEGVVRQRDDLMEFLFSDVADSISSNASVKAFIAMPAPEARNIVEENLVTRYLRGLGRYETDFYIFGRNGEPLFNADTADIRHFFNIVQHATPAGSKYLYFRENARDAHYYMAAIPILEGNYTIGYVFIDMTLKKAANATVYPELLQSARLKELQNNANYTYAIYSGRELITQVSDHPFPLYRRRDTLTEGQSRVIKSDGYDVVMYKVDKQKTVSIIVPKASVLKTITLFSYMLGVLMIFGFVAIVFRVYFHYILRRDAGQRLFHPTIRKRIHFAMLGIVFISFLIIGAVTILVFVDRYNDTNKGKLRSAIKRIERSIQQELKDRNVNGDPIAFDAISDEPDFRKFIADLANSQSIDINIYNSLGTLTTTSQDEIYNKLILARLMMPDAYYKLSDQNKVLLIEEEQIGRLSYLSGYVPIRNERGEAIGYVNVPYFSSQKELNYQISNILVALINFYAIIFLISSFFALIITNWITRGLQMIIERFQQFNLRQNEPLQWEHDDEIGLLVKAYNNMVKKVEESTSLLAQSERESAWREMARQVAHEIKNPLTPMKLNIQYLQQALHNGHPNIGKLTENVSSSLIEQIDNLSHIASAFSDFAKMPEALPETINLNGLLFKAAELYLNSTHISVHFEDADEPLYIYADRSQLLRVFTNLLQNAVEAIPEEKEGHIYVQLTRDGDNTLVTVSDNGNGIPEEIIDRIFSPYFTTKGSGTGLGLAMTRRIIEFWKGKIWFETKKGEGTTFHIVLPLASK